MKYWIFLFFVLSPLVVKAQQGHPAPLLNIGMGVFDFIDSDPQATFQLEYRPGFSIYRNECSYIRTTMGAMVTTEGASYYFAGLVLDALVLHRFALSFGLAPGVYLRGSGPELGCPIEFRSSAELALVFSNCSRVGLQFYHISNSTIGHRNPGAEAILIFCSIPLCTKNP